MRVIKIFKKVSFYLSILGLILNNYFSIFGSYEYGFITNIILIVVLIGVLPPKDKRSKMDYYNSSGKSKSVDICRPG